MKNGIDQKVVIVIPARYQSSRFPGKPLALIRDKPMIYWTYYQAKKVRYVSDVIVATDDDRIVRTCDEYGIKNVKTGSQHLTGTDRLAEVSETTDAEIYINIQGDEPLIEPAVVEELILFMIKNKDYICATVRSPIDDPRDAANNTVSKVVTDINGDIMYLSRYAIPYPKDSLDYVYYKALGVYAFRPVALEMYKNNKKAKNEEVEDIELLRLVERGIKIRDIIVDSHSPSVDTPKDLLRIKRLLDKEQRDVY